MIPQTVIDDIKRRNSIEDVVSSYVSLKRSGSSNMSGLCPFHSEKTPSFSVSTSEEFFYCFGCGAGGDVVTFVMRIENLTYVEAIEFLAKRAGITIPDDNQNRRGGVPEIKRDRILAINLEAARFFRDNLFSPIGAEALNYLTRRGLSMAVIKRFGLGYSPPDWSATTDYLLGKGFTQTELTAGFISAIGKNGRAYDYFRGRVMFPILDVNGRVIAFGGRIMGDGQPKYLNTSDTAAFKKSKNLFALNYAKDFCKERLILCEGYMDVIALHGAGYPYAVATLGTAITSDQARIMQKMTGEVLICYDADEAGQRAASKAFTILAETGVSSKIIKVTDAKDPDEYIKKFGAEAFNRVLSAGKSEFEFRFDNMMANYDLQNLQEKARAASEAAALIAYQRTETERELYGRRAAERLGIPFDALKNDAERIRKSAAKLDFIKETENAKRATEGLGDKINPDYIKNPAVGKSEEILIGAFLCRHDLLIGSLSPPISLTADDFITAFGKRVASAIIDRGERGGENPVDLGMLSEAFSFEEMGRITRVKVNASLTGYDGRAVKEAIDFLRGAAVKKSDLSAEEIIALKRKKIQE